MTTRLTNTLFLAILAGLPMGQAAYELANGEKVSALGVFGPLESERLRDFEDDLREASLMHRFVTPYYQQTLLGVFGRGNERAVLGRDGWLFLADDLDWVTGRGGALEGEGSPIDAIVHFRDQLVARGVELLLVPVLPKAAADADLFMSFPWTHGEFATPAHAGAFTASLDEHGVRYVDPLSFVPGMLYVATDDYLPRDTHWTPTRMHTVAEQVAEAARLAGPTKGITAFEFSSVEVSGAGDLVGMLRVPAGARLFDDMALTLQRVTPHEPDRDSPILLLGDSFTQVFSDARLGLGERAGFAEHLSALLGRRLDVIASPGGSALTVRETLARRSEGLAGKQLVIWQISMRDLDEGPELWKRVELPDARDVPDPVTEPGELKIVAELVETSRIPEGFDYEFCLGIFEYRVTRVEGGALEAESIWIAHVIMENREDTDRAGLRPGAKHRLTLEPVEEHHDLEDTSWVDDTDVGRSAIWFATDLEVLE